MTEKIELTKAEADDFLFRHKLIMAKSQEIENLKNEVVLFRRESLTYAKEIIAKYGKEYGADGDWIFDGSCLVKNQKQSS